MKLFIIIWASIGACYAGAPGGQYLPAQGAQASLGSSQSSYGGSQSSFGSSQVSFGSSGQSSFGGSQSSRPQAAVEKNAAILKLDSEVTADGFQYSYETTNGIRAEESGGPGGGRGGFQYVGDDGRTYSVTYAADAGGFRAQGAHLPVAPPTPHAILLALEQNARDEAAGIFDDGRYRAEQHGGGGGAAGGRPQHAAPSSSQQAGYRY